MKTTLLAAVLAVASIAFPQAVVLEKRMGGFAANSAYNKLYDLSTQLTFSGVVTGIQRVQPMPGMETGMTLLVKNDIGGGTAIVELGPTWFVDRQALQIKTMDRVNVTGSKVMIDGRGVILAKLVQVGTEVLALRRPNGVPYWDVANPIVALGPDPNVFELTGQLEEYRLVTDDGVVYSRLGMRTAGGSVFIDLGPQWFIEPQGFVFPVGTTVTVGAGNSFRRIPFDTPIPALWFTMGGRTFQLRSTVNGRGIWQGWRPN